MADFVPIARALFDRLAREVDVDTVLRRAQLPPSRFRVAKPQGTTAEFFALWRAVEESGADADLGLRRRRSVFALLRPARATEDRRPWRAMSRQA